jgi:hypothetical protein
MNLTQLDTAVDHVIIGLDYGTTGTGMLRRKLRDILGP